MKDRPEALQEGAATGDAQQLAPATPIGMAVGAEIPPSRPALIRTVRIRAEMLRGIHLARSSPRGHDTGWRRCGGLRARGGGVLTGVAVRLAGEARKGFRLAAARAPWWRGLRWCRVSRSTVAWPHPMEHEAHPHQGDEHQLVEKEIGNHGKTPS